MKNTTRYFIAFLLATTATAFFFVRTDREFTNNTPQEGELSAIKLSSDDTYSQSFVTTRHSISHLSLFLRPATTAPLPAATLSVTISRDNQTLAKQDINPSFIDKEGATQIIFSPPLSTTPGETITFSLTVPPELSNKIRAQLAEAKSSPDSTNPTFYHNNIRQPRPLAYQALFSYRPPLSYQLAILLLWLALILLWRQPLLSRPVLYSYLAASTLAFLLPALVLHSFSFALLITFLLAQSSMILLLKSQRLPFPAIILGANAFAFSTYWPLQLSADRYALLVFALLPLFFWLYLNRHITPRRKLTAISLLSLVALATIYFLPYQPPASPPLNTAHWRDIFLDPNQIATADKLKTAYYALQIPTGDPATIVQSGGWENFGSYLGLISFVLAIPGLISKGKKYWLAALLGLLAFFLAANPWLTPHLINPLLPPQYLIIITSFSLSFFAAWGLTTLWRFLGHDRLVNTIIYLIVLIALFDLLNVTSKTLQFKLL